jgi:hypothetical protein
LIVPPAGQCPPALARDLHTWGVPREVERTSLM